MKLKFNYELVKFFYLNESRVNMGLGLWSLKQSKNYFQRTTMAFFKFSANFDICIVCTFVQICANVGKKGRGLTPWD